MVYPGLLVLKPVNALWGVIRRGLSGMPLEETSVEICGSRVATDEMRARLERIGDALLDGYHAAPKSHALPLQQICR
jgi:hypothetical protein